MTRLQQDHSVDQLDGQTHHQVLEPFAEDEARSYIIQRYKAAQSLSEDQLRQLFIISGGLPGGLNQAVENLFRAGEISQEKTSRGLPRLHLVSIATVLIGVLLISLWQYWPEEQQNDDVRERVQLELPVTPAEKEAATIEIADEPATRKILPIPSLEPELAADDVKAADTKTDKASDTAPVTSATLATAKATEKEGPVSDTKNIEQGVVTAAAEKPELRKPLKTVSEKEPESVAKTVKDTQVTVVKPAEKKPVSKPVAVAEKSLLKWLL
ncbi:hypothetical protein [Aliamphritea spongicola]|nr:hypothetical protein [Aliamphritea spongicola]